MTEIAWHAMQGKPACMHHHAHSYEHVCRTRTDMRMFAMLPLARGGTVCAALAVQER